MKRNPHLCTNRLVQLTRLRLPKTDRPPPPFNIKTVGNRVYLYGDGTIISKLLLFGKLTRRYLAKARKPKPIKAAVLKTARRAP